MYYDLVASLPHLPHFERADRVPITPLRLDQRLRRLRPDHAEQLDRARRLVRWRPERIVVQSDVHLNLAYQELRDGPLEPALGEYIAFRMTQQTLLAALRRKLHGLELPEAANTWGMGPRVAQIRRNWEMPAFGLGYVYPWLPPASERLAAGDAIGLERLLMDLNWRWLSRRAEQNMFGFEAVWAFVFKWDMLQAWLTCDADQAQIRFAELVNQVTYVERN